MSSTILDWTEKYRPGTLDDIKGNNKAVGELRAWADEWQSAMEKRAVILYGSPGTGKTSAAYALAHDVGWSVMEMNASDQRTRDIINRIVGTASTTRSLFEDERKLIILDEADNLHGTADRGGVQAIINAVKRTKQPIVLIANEYYNLPPALRSMCYSIRFRDLQARSIIPVLRDICSQEGVKAQGAALESIAENANGDMRSGINDLQALAMGRDAITREDVIAANRDVKESIFKVLVKVFKRSDLQDARMSAFTLDESPEDFIQWLAENVPREYEGDDVTLAFRYLSRSDLMLGYVHRTQNYSLWRDAGALMIGGVMYAKSQRYGGFTRYQPPSRFRKLAQSRSSRRILDSLALKLTGAYPVSMRYARTDVIPFLQTICKNRDYAVRMAAELDLDVDEIAMLTGSGKKTKKVQNILEAAQNLREKPSVEVDEPDDEDDAGGEADQDNMDSKEDESNDTSPQHTLLDF